MATICPKCDYERKPTDTAPDYECPACGIIYAKAGPEDRMRHLVAYASKTGDWSRIPRDQIPPHKIPGIVASIPAVTTDILPGRQIIRSIDIVTAECAFGMNLFRDLFAEVSDTFGGRNKSTQTVLRDAKSRVLSELRAEAFAIGANAVVGVDLDYSEFSGGGKSMLFVVASGTAVITRNMTLEGSNGHE